MKYISIKSEVECDKSWGKFFSKMLRLNHCVNFRKKKVQKRILAKAGFEPGPTRVSTVGRFNH